MNRKKLWFSIVIVGFPLLLISQSIKWFNDAGIAQKTSLTGTEIIPLQQTGPNAYRWALASDVRRYMSGTNGAPVTVVYATTINVTTNYITNAFITLLTVQSNAYFYETNFVNYEFVTNITVLNTLNVESNAYFYQTNFNYYEITTNLLVTENIIVQSNLTVNNIINAKTAYVTNLITQTAMLFTNVWSGGPTGVVDLAISDQNYSAGADMAITGVTSKSNNVVQNVLLTILATGANRTLYLTGSFAEGTGATSYVCTNGVPREIWIRYSPALGGATNVCAMQFWR